MRTCPGKIDRSLQSYPMTSWRPLQRITAPCLLAICGNAWLYQLCGKVEIWQKDVTSSSCPFCKKCITSCRGYIHFKGIFSFNTVRRLEVLRKLFWLCFVFEMQSLYLVLEVVMLLSSISIKTHAVCFITHNGFYLAICYCFICCDWYLTNTGIWKFDPYLVYFVNGQNNNHNKNMNGIICWRRKCDFRKSKSLIVLYLLLNVALF